MSELGLTPIGDALVSAISDRDRYRDALQVIADEIVGSNEHVATNMQRRAREALAERVERRPARERSILEP